MPRLVPIVSELSAKRNGPAPVRAAPHAIFLTLLVAAVAVISVAMLLPGTTAPKQRAAPAETTPPWVRPDLADRLARITADRVEALDERRVRLVVAGFAKASIAGRRHPAAIGSRAVRSFRAWTASLPPSTRLGEVHVAIGEGRTTATVHGSLELPTRGFDKPGGAGATPEPHTLWTDVELRLQRRGPNWVVQWAKQDPDGLAALRSPIVVRDGRATVVADAASRDLAEDVARVANRAAVGIIADYPGMARPGYVTFYLARNEDIAKRLVDAPPTRHAAGWVTRRSDVVLLENRIARGIDDAALVAVVWHEMAHVLIAPLSDELPALLTEGLAEYIGITASLEAPDLYYRFGRTREAALERHYPYRRMLDSRDGSFYAHDGEIQSIGYHFGYVTIRWITTERGDRVLRRFLTVAARDGGSVAARRVLRMSPAALEDRVRDWVRDNHTVA